MKIATVYAYSAIAAVLSVTPVIGNNNGTLVNGAFISHREEVL